MSLFVEADSTRRIGESDQYWVDEDCATRKHRIRLRRALMYFVTQQYFV